MGSRWTARGNYWVVMQTLGVVIGGLAVVVITARQRHYAITIVAVVVMTAFVGFTVAGVRRGWFIRDK